MMNASIDLGAVYQEKGLCRFRVWAPFVPRVEVQIFFQETGETKLVSLAQEDSGYHSALVDNIPPDSRYFFRPTGDKQRPDPASQFQPQGVHNASAVVDHDFPWEDQHWTGIPLCDHVIYELHVGTFTPEGTFEAIIPRLGELQRSGINVLEIMPVAQFPGERNWGYDGVYPFAVQNSYGGPHGFKRLINACHKHGMAVILDVVYNHLGPEGNYLRDFGPYFTKKYRTPWGEALNFDGAYSDEVRNYFIQNALLWFKHYHVDALRLDAVHAIYDQSAVPFLQELAEAVAELRMNDGWQRYLIAESDLNDSRLIRPREVFGCGLDAQWCDDFHHSLHALITGEKDGYYKDFGSIQELVKALAEGFVYSGQHSPYRKRRHGNRSLDLPPEQFVVASQNHDQVGNRMLGERLAVLISFEAQKLAAAVLLLSPYIPLLFMGQEYGEEAPFLYFVSHQDPALVDAVRHGRKEEFQAFGWNIEPPDPADVETFLQSKLNWNQRNQGRHKVLLDFHSALLQMRRESPAFSALERTHMEVHAIASKDVILLKRWWGESNVLCLFNFAPRDVILRAHELPSGTWSRLLDSAEERWQGPGTLLPDRLRADQSITLRKQSAVVCGRQEDFP